jgi:Uncharacterized conserved protein
MWNNIPMELRALPQWVCAGPDKVPLNPRTGQPASVTDPNTWATFEEAVRAGMKYIGFVLTEWDPYTIIDLDNKPSKPCTPEQWARHQKILEAFNSYTERSASGTGYHIIVKGRVPTGVHRDNVEVYSSARYMICTGDVVRNVPIADYQHLLDVLYGEMKPADVVELDDVESPLSDEEVVEMAMRAANADKFNALCRGEWQAMGYASQSEADFALLSILAYYTRDNEQVRRLFRMSQLGKRDKALKNDKYLNYALSKIRAQQPPLVDFEELKANLASATSTPEAPAPALAPYIKDTTPVVPGISLPPGLVGEVAQYIYQTAIRPVPEIALGAAIAITAGVCARSYNISGTGLNQYLILLAKTGAGKEGAATGIDNLIAAVRPQVPMVDQFIGPSAFASGQALIKVLDERPCFVSILGEFGLTLRQLCDPRASSPQIMLKKVLLDLYNKSGWNKVLRPSVYSDTDKNTNLVQAPNVTILGESTPESFFEGLDSAHIAEGLIPRFLVIEYTGPRPPRNRNANQPPSPQLVARFTELVSVSLAMTNNGTCANVQVESTALQLLDEFDAKADEMINSASSDVDMQLWNRAHLKALKLAALVAVGCNPHSPVVTPDIARWSIDLVERDVAVMTTRFQRGEIGVGDHRHEADIRKAVEAYLAMSEAQRLQYKTPKSLLNQPVVPFHYLRRKLRLLSAFKNDRRGVARALEESLKDMVKAEILQIVPPQQALEKFGVTTELYVKGPMW